MNMKLCGFFVFFLSWRICECLSKVKIENNQYKGMVVAIHPSISENQIVINALKEILTNASRNLFVATKSRAYFSEITILVPRTWTNGVYNLSGSETYSTADVIIAPQSPIFGVSPYTLQYGSCGDPGQYIHLSPEFVTLEIGDFGPKGKAVVHEWAHFRWGVFDERNTTGFPKFYLRNDSVEATRCPASLSGFLAERTETGFTDCTYNGFLPNNDCDFIPHGMQGSGLTASLMSHHNLSQVTTFCHSDPNDPINMHNTDAPNEQNRLCTLQSTWDVIMNSDDFRDGANPPNQSITDTTPLFKVVKARRERFVMVMDVSGSMRGTRLQSMVTAVTEFISRFVSVGVYVGLVQFSTSAAITAELTQIDTNNTAMQKLIDALPTSASGSTGIGSGIRSGIDALKTSGFTTASGGQLIVLTDGEENISPLVNDVFDEVIQNEVVMHTIFFDLTDATVNEALVNLSTTSGGMWFTARSASGAAELNIIFQSLSRVTDGDLSRASVNVFGTATQLNSGQNFSSSVLIDGSIGLKTTFTFGSLNFTSPPMITIKTPQTNCYYSNDNTPMPNTCGNQSIHTTNDRTVTFEIPDIAETGSWEYTITNNELPRNTFTVSVTSSASDPNTDPIIVLSGVTETAIEKAGQATIVFAQVFQGFLPVLNAEVTARITPPTGNVSVIKLFDGGSGADTRRNDGVYSSYFTEFNTQGRYSIQVKVMKESNTNSALGSSTSGAAFNLGTVDQNGNFIQNPNGEKYRPSGAVQEAVISGGLERVTSGGGFAYTGEIMSGDAYPPNRITDLYAEQVNLIDRDSGIRLTFTAPGDDLDSGTAARYEIRFTFGKPTELTLVFNTTFLITDSNVITGSLNQPRIAQSEENLVVMLHSIPENISNVRVALAIRTLDEVNNTAEVSNIAVITYYLEPPPMPKERSATIGSGASRTTAMNILGLGLVLSTALGVVAMLVTAF